MTWCEDYCECQLCLEASFEQTYYWKQESCFFCQEKDCQTKVTSGDYCFEHGNTCLDCSERIATNKRYCLVCTNQNNLQSLVKQRTSISGIIKEVERFSTWWNNNIATVTRYYNGYYRVFLLVYNEENDTVKVFPEIYDCNYWGDSNRGRKRHNCLSDAKNEAKWLKNELIKERGEYWSNPILLIHPGCDVYRSFSGIVDKPFVIEEYLSTDAKQNPDKYLKFLDILKVKNIKKVVSYYHYGVYLGNYQVCHFTKDKNNTSIDSWNYFLEGSSGDLIRYHSVIPFKNYQTIIRQIVWAKDNNFRKGQYNLANRNCEHLANMMVYGVNFSQQVHERYVEFQTRAASQAAGIGLFGGIGIGASLLTAPATGGLSLLVAGTMFTKAVIWNKEEHGINNDNKKFVCLTNELKETNNLLKQKSDYETKKYEEQYLIEIPPKQECRMM